MTRITKYNASYGRLIQRHNGDIGEAKGDRLVIKKEQDRGKPQEIVSEYIPQIEKKINEFNRILDSH